MRTDEPKEVGVGEYKAVEGGNFVTVVHPEPQYGVSAARGIDQLLKALGRSAVPATEPAAKATPARGSSRATGGDTGAAGKTAKTGDVAEARKGASGT
jgi:hypothetical protein